MIDRAHLEATKARIKEARARREAEHEWGPFERELQAEVRRQVDEMYEELGDMVLSGAAVFDVTRSRRSRDLGEGQVIEPVPNHPNCRCVLITDDPIRDATASELELAYGHQKALPWLPR